MTVSELYTKLKDENFLKPYVGAVGYNYYIYSYPANKEYEFRKQIAEFKENLIRPNTYADVLCLNLYDEMCGYLSSLEAEDSNMLDFILSNEGTDELSSEDASEIIQAIVSEKDFVSYINDKITAHLSIIDNNIRPYIFLYGVGAIYPFMRVNQFLTLFEDFNRPDAYKLIVFYPGQTATNTYTLFGKLYDKHSYRAVRLNENHE